MSTTQIDPPVPQSKNDLGYFETLLLILLA